jgi:hypothetical protein
LGNIREEEKEVISVDADGNGFDRLVSSAMFYPHSNRSAVEDSGSSIIMEESRSAESI